MSLRPPGIASLRRQAVVDSLCCRCTAARNVFFFSLTTTTTAPPRPPRFHSTSPCANIARRTFAQARTLRADVASPSSNQRQGSSGLKSGYFLSNSFQPTAALKKNASSTDNSAARPTEDLLPHRRRRRKAAAETASTTPPPASTSADANQNNNKNNVLPAQDASSSLTTTAASQSSDSIRRQLSIFLSLSKPRLTMLVVLTAMATYALYPVPAFLSPSIGLDTPSLSPLTLLFLTTGTALCSASANALNMLYEPDTDSKMSRTRNRPLVRGLLSSRRALAFAAASALAGVGSLWFGVNPTVAFLGFANIAIYAGMYTPMKRLSWLNTWVGAVVGGIPPLMGWAAAAGESATGDGSFRELLFTTDAVGGWLMAALLFAWQFPHFMALSWSIRDEYKAAGHKMLAWIDPARNARVALRYSIAFFPICVGLCMVGVTEWSFAATSFPVNAWLAREAVRFWRFEGHKGSARGLFWASVWHLPVVMVLALAQKKGMWSRVWRSVMGQPIMDEGGDEDYDEEEWEIIQAAVAKANVATATARQEAGAGQVAGVMRGDTKQ